MLLAQLAWLHCVALTLRWPGRQLRVHAGARMVLCGVDMLPAASDWQGGTRLERRALAAQERVQHIPGGAPAARPALEVQRRRLLVQLGVADGRAAQAWLAIRLQLQVCKVVG